MSIVYLLKNQHDHYLDKSGEWVSAENARTLYRALYKDEALNRKVEFSVKNSDLRISIFEAALNDKGNIELSDDEALGQISTQSDAFDLSAANAEHKDIDDIEAEHLDNIPNDASELADDETELADERKTSDASPRNGDIFEQTQSQSSNPERNSESSDELEQDAPHSHLRAVL